MKGDKFIRLNEEFQKIFSARAQALASAPGRVNLIGEHTDYNQGFVLPIAIDRRIWAAGRARDDGKILLSSLNQPEEISTSIDGIRRRGNWGDYPNGVIQQLLRMGIPLQGLEALFYGDIPLGSGLSSSAALEVTTLTLLQRLYGFELAPIERVQLCHQAEVNFVGVRCGVMDQFISTLGKKGHALSLDCRSLEYHQVHLNLGKYKVVICNSKVKRGLAASQYNIRRRECEDAVSYLSQTIKGINSLRDITIRQLEEHQELLPKVIYQRARHVVSENNRVLEAVQALEKGNLVRFGELLNQSHQSLRDDYQVSCPELDLLVETAQGIDGVLGSRLTGAGFGGCTVSIVQGERLKEFERRIVAKYQKSFGILPEVYVIFPQDGAREDKIVVEKVIKK